jgi:hypothetical protein
MPATRAKVSSLGGVSAASIMRHAAVTLAAFGSYATASAGASGLQRLQARYPAATASALVE